MEYETLSLFGIEVLEFCFLDVMENGTQYSEGTFTLKTLKKFDGRIVIIMNDWKVLIFDHEGESVEEEFFLIENDEFRELLYSKFPIK
ncbi:hypothetical protein [Brevibacillus sp. NRS-1366]|uniref:hypothetical protein n=1 Tax=Brevibacillus sp. NRS-1366 TaxID=3233899 RepID=UPI003D22FDE4